METRRLVLPSGRKLPGIVYVVGAGLNQSIKDQHSLSPPMLKNFFQIALKHPRLSHESRLRGLEPLFAYIEKYWKKTRADLSSSDFDLEECFTLLETQRQDAIKSNDEGNARTLYSIEFSLKGLLAELLSDFETFSLSSETMRAFGKMIYDQKAVILSFNYDTMTEAAIESGSGLRGLYPKR